MKSMTFRTEIGLDGTIRLEIPSDLPPGPVKVMVVVQADRPSSVDAAASSEGDNWFMRLERIRATREASGYKFRTEEEIIAEIEDLRSGWDDKVDEVYRQIEVERAREGQG